MFKLKNKNNGVASAASEFVTPDSDRKAALYLPFIYWLSINTVEVYRVEVVF